MMSRGTLQIALAVVCVCGAAGVGAGQSALPRTLDAKGPISFFIADGTGRAGFRAGDRQLAQWAFEAWERSAGRRLRFEAAPEASALIRLYWAESNEGQYGEMRPLMVDGKRGAAVYIRPDVEALGAGIARLARSDVLLRDTIVYLTCLHELGHAIGLAHTSEFVDIMYFFGYGGDIGEYFGRYRRQLRFRDDIAATSGLSDTDVSRLRAMYTAR
jgi:matrixin